MLSVKSRRRGAICSREGTGAAVWAPAVQQIISQKKAASRS